MGCATLVQAWQAGYQATTKPGRHCPGADEDRVNGLRRRSGRWRAGPLGGTAVWLISTVLTREMAALGFLFEVARQVGIVGDDLFQ